MSPRRRFALVYNARAGIALPRRLDGVLAGLSAARCEVFVLPARTAAEATERVAEAAESANCDAVISAGGDGTFRAVASGAAGTQLPVGVIPLGTGNVLARELGLPRRGRDLAELLMRGPVLTAKAGLANGQPFFLMCGAGFDGHIVSGLDYNAKRAFGRGAYARPVIRALSKPPHRFDIDVDGARFEASWVIVARASHYGGFKLTNATGVGAENMVAVVIAAETRLQLATTSLWLARGRLTDETKRPPFVKVMPARAVEIGCLTIAPAQIDGDDAGETPLSIRSDGPVVRIIAPPAYARRVADLTNRHANRVS